jgi:hypothetical protein
MSDISTLHHITDELRTKQQDIVHSIVNRMIYIKNLDDNTRLNLETLTNLSIVKDNMLKSHETFQHTARDLMYLNLTTYGQSSLLTAIRQLEISIS